MGLLKKFINRQDFKALELFTKANWINRLTREQSRKNIEDSLVEIIYDSGDHSSNGFLITENGYFLTAEHCIRKNALNKRIRTSNGEVYPIEKVCYSDFPHDLALVKAKIKSKPVIKNYNLYNTNKLEKIPVQILARWDKKIVRKYGFVELTTTSCNDHRKNFCSDIFSIARPIISGDSGGIIISPLSELIGFVHGSDKRVCCGIKLNNALKLIYKYINS